MLRFTAILWAYAVSWVFAAFLHSVDADMSGFQSLFVPAVFASVSLVALAILIPATLCYVAYSRGSWRTFFSTICAFAICLSTVLMLLGFGGNSVGEWFVGFLGSATIFCVVLVVVSLPMVLSRASRNAVSGART